MEFAHRGVVEGFYGPPFSHADRLWLIERLGRWGMNRYVYAPKDDPLHRSEWRTRYGAEALAAFRELVECGSARGVELGFAVSPGLSISYASEEDRAALVRKLEDLREVGVRFFALALDDVSSELPAPDRAAFASLAEAQVDLAHALRDALAPDGRLWLVPTDYLGTEPSDYLEALGGLLDPEIEVGWTGRTVVSPSIRADEAARRARTLGRRLLLWDNVPVADGPMRSLLHLGPYANREPQLPEHVSGVLLNPMQHAHASALALRTAADYLAEPAAYDLERSFGQAVTELGAGAPEAFELFAAAHRFSALRPEDRDAELEAAFGALRRSCTIEKVAAFQALLQRRLAAAAVLRDELEDRELAKEIEPWIASHHEESGRMAAAAELLATLLGEAPRMQQVLAFFRFEARLRTPPPGAVSYGPRRVLYPQLVSLRDREATFGPDPALFEHRCLTDEVVRFAEDRALAHLGGRRSS